MISKFLRAARLDRTVFEEVRWDDEVTGQTVIGIAIITTAQFVLFTLLGRGLSGLGFSLLRGLIEAVVIGAALWLLASLALWVVAAYVFNTRRPGQEVVRIVGVGYLPYILVGGIPLSIWTPVAAAVWFVAVLSVGVQVLYGFELRKAVPTAVLGVAVWFLAILLLF